MEAIKNSLQTVTHVVSNFKQHSTIGPLVYVTKHVELTCLKCLRTCNIIIYVFLIPPSQTHTCVVLQ